MAHYTSLLENLKKYDVPVIEIDGWRTRGSSTFNPKGGVNHHTVGPRRGFVPSLGVCINGRSDVPGPLCHILGGRDHVARLIACGRANHAGKGGNFGLSGNSSVFGLEMEHTGIAATEPVLPETIEFMARIQAAFALTGGYNADKVMQHWEWTSRKIDFVKGSLDPNHFRGMVEDLLKKGGVVLPPPPLPPKPSEDQLLMSAKDEIVKQTRGIVESGKPFAVRIAKGGYDMKQGEVWVVSASGRYHIDRKALNVLYFVGSIQRDDNGQPSPINAEDIASIPVLYSPVFPKA